jgi:release factor glutamine methyltransferase
MHSPIKRAWFKDLRFDITEDVFEPSEDSFLFAENLDMHEGDVVLDLGTGCGILGIVAAEKAKSVLAVDVNPYAIRCAKQNASLNKVREKMGFLRGDLLTALDASALFDVILFNAPYLPSEPNEFDSWIGRAWAGGATGRDVVDCFIPQAARHLTQSGRILMLQSTLTGLEQTIQKFQQYGLEAAVKAETKLPFFETIHLIEAKVVS